MNAILQVMISSTFFDLKQVRDQEALEWGIRIRRIVPNEDLDPMIRSMERFADDVLGGIEEFGPRLLQEIARIEEAEGRGEPLPSASVTLTIDIPGVEQFIEAADLLTQKLRER